MLWGCRLSGARFFLGLNLVCPLSNGNRGRSPHPPPETTSSFFSVKCIRSTPEYFAERLFKAMKVRDGFDVNEVRGGWVSAHPTRTLGQVPVVHWPKGAFGDWPQVRVRADFPGELQSLQCSLVTPLPLSTCPGLPTEQRAQ